MSRHLYNPARRPAIFGFVGPHARDDLEWLGWDDTAAAPLAWVLAGSGDPDLALAQLRRLGEALGEDYPELAHTIETDERLRVRLFALLGGSAALGDHLVANPQSWRLLHRDIPTEADMFRNMLTAVDAEPAGDPDDPAIPAATRGGTYRAGERFTAAATAQHPLRTAYRNLIMRIAAADLASTYVSRGGLHVATVHLDYDQVAALLSSLADAALTAALAVAVRVVYGERPIDGRLCVMAMGKCGARELNYISDVDVIFVSEPVTAQLTRVASEMMRLGGSCFFEVDANLRPEGRSGSLCRTLDSHLAYYHRWAKTWEFQALLKARPMTGYLPLGNDYVTALAPSVWSACQRESFVEDVQAMRIRVIDNVPDDIKDRELKLEAGGLRDVEFAVQLLQLVHGRSDESLRVKSTTDALRALTDGGYVGRDDSQALIHAYEQLRLYEHRLQLTRLQRTHVLPPMDDTHGWQWLAAASGYTATAAVSAVELLHQDLARLRRQVESLHTKLFYRPLLKSVVGMSVGALRLSPEGARDQLAALGYRHPQRAFEHLSSLASGTSRAAKLQAILLPTLMRYLAQTPDPDAGLLNYRRLSEAACDRTWYLRTLRDEGVVAQRLMYVLGTSPYAADLFISSPDIIKKLSDGATGPKLMDTAPNQVYKALVAASKRHKNPDKAVARARALRRVDLARIAAADLLGFMPTAQVCRELSYVWLAVLESAIRAEVRASILAGDVDEAPARLAIIGMGRLGGWELGYGSDADVMVVARPAPGVPDAEAVAWSIRIIDRLRTRLSKPSVDPPLDVDLGLRPEGRSGPIVRTIESYRRYYEQWAETWEIQALQRATYVAGDESVAEEFLHMIDRFRYPTAGATAAQIKQMRRMKARVDNERLPRGADRSTHTKLGRGALTDIEWTVQLITMEHAHEVPDLHNTSTLEILDALIERDDPAILAAEQAKTLKEAWLIATAARNAIVLVRGTRKDQLPQPGPELARVAGAAGWPRGKSQDFLETYLRLTRRARKVVDVVFWGEDTESAFDGE